jgi:hypothetical protein
MVWNSHSVAGVAFIVTGLLFALAGGRNLPAKKYDLAKLKPFHGPILALEFVDTPQRASDILTQMTPEEIGRQTKGDSYIFIPLYTLVLCVAAFLVFRWAQIGAGSTLRLGAFALVACLVFAAAASDYRENGGIFDLLDATKGKRTEAVKEMTELQPNLDRIRSAALTKWGLLFVVLLLVAAPLVVHGGGGWAVGGLLLLTGALGLASLAPSARVLVEWAFVMMGLSLAALGLWFASL